MSATLDRLAAALADRYRLERELGQAWRLVARATARLMSLKRLGRGHFRDFTRGATERLWERSARPAARESLRAALAASSRGAN